MTTGRFELMQDEDTGRLYWFGGEDGWKDATEVGEDGTLTVNAEHFRVGAMLLFSEPDEGTLWVVLALSSSYLSAGVRLG